MIVARHFLCGFMTGFMLAAILWLGQYEVDIDGSDTDYA